MIYDSYLLNYHIIHLNYLLIIYFEGKIIFYVLKFDKFHEFLINERV